MDAIPHYLIDRVAEQDPTGTAGPLLKALLGGMAGGFGVPKAWEYMQSVIPKLDVPGVPFQLPYSPTEPNRYPHPSDPKRVKKEKPQRRKKPKQGPKNKLKFVMHKGFGVIRHKGRRYKSHDIYRKGKRSAGFSIKRAGPGRNRSFGK